jgi:hypothetical protein
MRCLLVSRNAGSRPAAAEPGTLEFSVPLFEAGFFFVSLITRAVRAARSLGDLGPCAMRWELHHLRVAAIIPRRPATRVLEVPG